MRPRHFLSICHMHSVTIWLLYLHISGSIMSSPSPFLNFIFLPLSFLEFYIICLFSYIFSLSLFFMFNIFTFFNFFELIIIVISPYFKDIHCVGFHIFLFICYSCGFLNTIFLSVILIVLQLFLLFSSWMFISSSKSSKLFCFSFFLLYCFLYFLVCMSIFPNLLFVSSLFSFYMP